MIVAEHPAPWGGGGSDVGGETPQATIRVKPLSPPTSGGTLPREGKVFEPGRGYELERGSSPSSVLFSHTIYEKKNIHLHSLFHPE